MTQGDEPWVSALGALLAADEEARAAGLGGTDVKRRIVTPWPDFDVLAAGGLRYRVAGLIPADGLGFIAAAPKRGKTWLGLGLGIAVATGSPFLSRFEVVERCPVLYVALEGAPGGVRARIGALARGMGVDPDSAELRDWFHLAYKPRGLNLSDPSWADALVAEAEERDAGIVILDVLRRAATIRESGEGVGDFAALLRNLEPLTDEGRFLTVLHHFRKTTGSDEDVDVAERMAGSGSLYGHYDAALFITSAAKGGPMQVQADARDFRPPRPFGVELQGEPTGPWGFVYEDVATLVALDTPARKVTKATPDEIRAVVVAGGGNVAPRVIRERLGITDATLRERRPELAKVGVRYVRDGKESRYELMPDQGVLT